MLPSLGVFSLTGSFRCLFILFALLARFMLLGSFYVGLFSLELFFFFCDECSQSFGTASKLNRHHGLKCDTLQPERSTNFSSFSFKKNSPGLVKSSPFGFSLVLFLFAIVSSSLYSTSSVELRLDKYGNRACHKNGGDWQSRTCLVLSRSKVTGPHGVRGDYGYRCFHDS
jgi:hypothetical protein